MGRYAYAIRRFSREFRLVDLGGSALKDRVCSITLSHPEALRMARHRCSVVGNR